MVRNLEGQSTYHQFFRLSQTNGIGYRIDDIQINAFLTDSTQNLHRLPIRDLIFEDNTILFKASYETQRGLQRNVVFRGLRTGPYMKIEFSGSEGGRAFRGKWQARHFPSPALRHTTQPTDTTSTTS
ncbi:MAG: hypothetical protein ACE5I1_24525 [bacterium]